MKFSVVVCTYMRPNDILKMLDSIKIQTLYPDEILVIDGSPNDLTKSVLEQKNYKSLKYYKVPENERGLTKQRNFGIARVAGTSEVVCFLDDDTILEANYFEEIVRTFQNNPLISGVGGVAINENNWTEKVIHQSYHKNYFYQFEGFIYKEGQRNVLRNYFGLQSNLGPGRMPDYSHGRTCGFPLTRKIYEVDLLIGMSMAFRKKVVDNIRFSTYFEGYGLYEDADYSIRALQFGKNVINTKAQLSHYHAPSGRPNQYTYGKMVVRNGWYVWRVKNRKPKLKVRLKWNTIALLLILIRFTNVIKSQNKKEAFTEALGRTVGWFSLFVNRPKIES